MTPETRPLQIRLHRDAAAPDVRNIEAGGVLAFDYDALSRPGALEDLKVEPGEKAGIWLRFFNYCNHRCVFCPDPHVDIGRLNTSRVIRLLEDMARLGHRRVTLSGGEPTLERNLPELVGRLKAAGYTHISVATNASRLSHRPYADELISAGVTELYASLQGVDAVTGDRANGRVGTFHRVLQGLENARAVSPTLFITLNHVVLEDTAERLVELVPLARSLQAQCVQISLFERYVHRAIKPVAAPRLAAIAASFERFLPALRDAGIQASIEGIPPCFYRGYERCYLDYRRSDPRRVRVIIEPNGDRDLVLLTRGSLRGHGHEFSPACESCAYRKACSGVYFSYARDHGLDELRPVKIEDVRAAGSS